MSKHARRTGPAHPWRRTARTVFAALVAGAAMAPAVYSAATQHDPTAATGYAATGLAIAAAVTRVLALPIVEAFLRRFAPFLSAGDVAAEKVLAVTGPAGTAVAGEASPIPTGAAITPATTVAQLTGPPAAGAAPRNDAGATSTEILLGICAICLVVLALVALFGRP